MTDPVRSGAGSLPSWLTGFLPADNAVFSGGLGLAILAAGAQMLRSGSTLGMTMVKRYLLVTLEVTSKDRSYPWVLQWLSAQRFRNQHLSVETTLKAKNSIGNNSLFDLVPGPGMHFISYRGKFLSVQRIREAQMVDLNTGPMLIHRWHYQFMCRLLFFRLLFILFVLQESLGRRFNS